MANTHAVWYQQNAGEGDQKTLIPDSVAYQKNLVCYDVPAMGIPAFFDTELNAIESWNLVWTFVLQVAVRSMDEDLTLSAADQTYTTLASLNWSLDLSGTFTGANWTQTGAGVTAGNAWTQVQGGSPLVVGGPMANDETHILWAD
jgi:hypothetical protein